MSKRIPQTIKDKVIQEWLSGLPRNRIAQINGIGAGTVSTIIKDFDSIGPDLDLLREVAVMVKKNNISLSQFASSIRLKNVLSALSIQEEKVESFLENVNVHCFKKGIDPIIFIQKVEEVSSLLRSYNVHLDDLISFYEQKRESVNSLIQQEQQLNKSIAQLYNEVGVTKENLKLYCIDRNLDSVLRKKEKELEDTYGKISQLEHDFNAAKSDALLLKHFKTIPKDELAKVKASISFDRPLTGHDLFNIFLWCFKTAGKNTDIVAILLERFGHNLRKSYTSKI